MADLSATMWIFNSSFIRDASFRQQGFYELELAMWFPEDVPLIPYHEVSFMITWEQRADLELLS